MNEKDSKNGKNNVKEEEEGHSKDPRIAPCFRCLGIFYRKKRPHEYKVGKAAYVQRALRATCDVCKEMFCSWNCLKLHKKEDCLGLPTWGETRKRTERKRKMQKKQYDGKVELFDLNEPLS